MVEALLGGDVRVWRLPRRRIANVIVFAVVSLTVTACGDSDPYQAGWIQFGNQVLEHSVKNATADWTIYVGYGTVTTGWLWFKHQNPVVYAQVENTGTSNITDLEVQFGDKTVKSPGQSPDSSVEFYTNSSQIPQYVDISWKINGQPRHETIDSKSMIEVDLSP